MTDVFLFDIQRGSLVDGPGMRTVVFFKGCNLRCSWCHNPESQSSQPELMIEKDRCTDCGLCRQVCKHPRHCTLCGDCVAYCPGKARKFFGKRWSLEDVFDQIRKDTAFYKSTGGGVTFSGGECMLQPDGLLALLMRCKEQNIHTAVDTAGHIPWESFEKIIPFTDLFLYDVKCLDSARHREYTGAGNERILENLSRLLAMDKDVIIRIPVVAGINDDPVEMTKLQKLLRSWGRPRAVELLPYHSMGEGKRRALGMPCRPYRAPEPEKMQELENVWKQEGF